MNAQLVGAARRLAASKHWSLLPGMLTDVGERVTDPSVCYLGVYPDLEDEQTVELLVTLLDRAWRGTVVLACPEKPGWWVAIMPAGPWPAPAPSRAEAAVNALEVAPSATEEVSRG